MSAAGLAAEKIINDESSGLSKEDRYELGYVVFKFHLNRLEALKGAGQAAPTPNVAAPAPQQQQQQQQQNPTPMPAAADMMVDDHDLPSSNSNSGKDYLVCNVKQHFII